MNLLPSRYMEVDNGTFLVVVVGKRVPIHPHGMTLARQQQSGAAAKRALEAMLAP